LEVIGFRPVHIYENLNCDTKSATLIDILFFGNIVLHFFLFASLPNMALEPTQPPIQWVSGALSPEVKRPGREADYSLPSSAKVKNAWSSISTPSHVFKAWFLVEYRVLLFWIYD
jgi:hypothetical protein